MEATGNFVHASQCFTISTETKNDNSTRTFQGLRIEYKNKKSSSTKHSFSSTGRNNKVRNTYQKKKKRKKTRASTCTVPNCFRHLRIQMQTSPEFAGSQSKGSACEVYCGNDHGERKRKESDCDGWLTPLRGSASAASTSSPPRLPGVAQHKTGSQRI